jgi:hypothetical protein
MYVLLVYEIIPANKIQTERYKGSFINIANFDYNYSENRWTEIQYYSKL